MLTLQKWSAFLKYTGFVCLTEMEVIGVNKSYLGLSDAKRHLNVNDISKGPNQTAHLCGLIRVLAGELITDRLKEVTCKRVDPL